MQLIAFSAERAPHLATLLSDDRPIPVRLWAMLDGSIQSRMLVDQPHAPTIALVQELAEGTTYVGGALTSQALLDGITLLRQEQEVVICFWPDDPLSALLPAAPSYAGTAIDFTHRSAAVDSSAWRSSLPAISYDRSIAMLGGCWTDLTIMFPCTGAPSGRLSTRSDIACCTMDRS